MELDGLPEIGSTEPERVEDTLESNETMEPGQSLLADEDQEERAELPDIGTEENEGLPDISGMEASGLPEIGASEMSGLPEVAVPPEAVALPEVAESAEAEILEEEPEPLEEAAKNAEKAPEDLLEDKLEEEIEPLRYEEAAEVSSGKRKLEEEEKSRKKQKVAERSAGEVLQLSLSLDEVQSLMDLKEAASNQNRSFYTVDALIFACKKAMETQPDFDETTGLRIDLQLLPTHLTYQQLLQFRAQLLCHRLLVRNMQPPDRVLHTARGGYNKKELEYTEFRRNLLPNIPETIQEMNEYDKQSRIELANRRAKFWTDLQAAGY